jgi:dolichol-phosphate mannosyltransferase
VVAKLAHMNARIYEMGISYHGRTYAEGKKIGTRDGWRALYCIFKYNAAYMPYALKAVLLAAGFGIAGLLLIDLIF